MTDEIPDDATEIVNARLPRVDLVKAPASGMPFFIAKQSLEETSVTPDPVEKSEADDTLAAATANPKLGDERPAAAPGDPDDPSSAAWEAVDAANARAAVNTLVELKSLVAGLLSREALEAVTGDDPDDGENAYDLDGVLCALDCALSVLAPFAVTEQAEADDRAEDALVKASGLAAGCADVIAKAGRVLSASNETAIRNAVESLQKVLASLPPAKEADMTKADETVEPTADDVAKAADVATETVEVEKAEEEGAVDTEPVAKAEDLSELSDDDLKRLAITGEDGQRAAALAEIGLRVLTGNPEPDDAPDNDGDGVPDDATQDAADVDPNDAGSPMDMAKSETDDPIAKALHDLKADYESKLESVVKELAEAKEEIAKLGDQPAPSRVLSNGALPPAEHLRGQDDTASAVPPSVQVAELRKEFSETLDPAKQKEIGDQMQSLAFDAITRLHSGR